MFTQCYKVVYYVKKLFIRFINFQEKMKANFNEVRTQLKELESKIDGLKELFFVLVTCFSFFKSCNIDNVF